MGPSGLIKCALHRGHSGSPLRRCLLVREDKTTIKAARLIGLLRYTDNQLFPLRQTMAVVYKL